MKYLYLPIEIWSREFHAKTLLGLYGASKGWSVVIGPKSEMHRRLPRLPRGVVLQFGFHKNFAAEMKRLRSFGHKVVAADEEGLVTLSPEHYSVIGFRAKPWSNATSASAGETYMLK